MAWIDENYHVVLYFVCLLKMMCINHHHGYVLMNQQYMCYCLLDMYYLETAVVVLLDVAVVVVGSVAAVSVAEKCYDEAEALPQLVCLIVAAVQKILEVQLEKRELVNEQAMLRHQWCL